MNQNQLGNWFSDFEGLLLSASKTTTKESTKDGTTLIGHRPDHAKYAYEHKLFPSLSLEEQKEIEEKLNFYLPRELALFYSRLNGCELFLGGLSIYGVRNAEGRSVSSALTQPFDICDANKERPKYRAENKIMIGSFHTMKAFIIADLGSGGCVETYDGALLMSYENIFDFLTSSVKRISE